MLTAVFAGVVAVGLTVAWIVSDSSSNKVAERDQPAPDFSVSLLDGDEFALSKHLAADGRPVVLNLWASWCAPCRTEIPEISAWALANPDVYVIGVAVEDREEDAKKLTDELKPSYDMAIGDQAFRNSYPSLGLPATYFIDGDGDIAELVNGIVTAELLDATKGAISG